MGLNLFWVMNLLVVERNDWGMSLGDMPSGILDSPPRLTRSCFALAMLEPQLGKS